MAKEIAYSIRAVERQGRIVVKEIRHCPKCEKPYMYYRQRDTCYQKLCPICRANEARKK